jgi:hypothetical protein
MAITVSEIKEILKDRKFPCVLTAEELATIAEDALRDLSAGKPVTAFGVFQTVEDVADYRICDPDDETTEGFAEEAIVIRDVWYNPVGDLTAIDLFNPTWRLLQDIVASGAYFHNPSDMKILRTKLSEWDEQFGDQGWTFIGEPGDAAAYLHLNRIPLAGTYVMVEYAKPHSLSTIRDGNSKRYFWQWMDFHVAAAMARYYSASSGVDLLGFKTSSDALEFWSKERDRLEQRAFASQRGPQGLADRS